MYSRRKTQKRRVLTGMNWIEEPLNKKRDKWKWLDRRENNRLLEMAWEIDRLMVYIINLWLYPNLPRKQV
jgi:hypothetical protein